MCDKNSWERDVYLKTSLVKSEHQLEEVNKEIKLSDATVEPEMQDESEAAVVCKNSSAVNTLTQNETIGADLGAGHEAEGKNTQLWWYKARHMTRHITMNLRNIAK